MEPVLYVASAITGLTAALAIVWKIRCWAKKIIDGIKCHLRAEMLRVYYRNHEHGTIKQYELENFIMTHQAYKALGGNSFIEAVYKETVTWEVKE